MLVWIENGESKDYQIHTEEENEGCSSCCKYIEICAHERENIQDENYPDLKV